MASYAALQLTLRAIAILLLITAGAQFLIADQIPIAAVVGAHIIFVLSLPGVQYAFIVTRLAFALAAFTILLAGTAWWRESTTVIEAGLSILVFGYLAYASLTAIEATNPKRTSKPDGAHDNSSPED